MNTTSTSSNTAPPNGIGEGSRVGESYRAASTPFQHNHQFVLANGHASKTFRAISSQQDVADGPVKRRRGHRTSGGFLLDSAHRLGSRAVSTKDNIARSSQDKGKAREITGNGILNRNKSRLSEPRGRSPLGRSPLMMEAEEEALQTSRTTPKSISSSDYTHVENYPTASPDSLNGSPELQNRRTRQTPRVAQPPAFDADPTEIVNLALNLSESRRRQASFGTFPPIDPFTSRRVVSVGQGNLRDPYDSAAAPGGSLKQYLQQQRKISRNYSPRSTALDHPNSPNSANRWREGTPENQFPKSPFVGLGIAGDVQFNPSDATLLRAERVKTTLELFYEYRRVLQYLPKLPPPSNVKGSHKKKEEVSALGREYNPLQYIRNRKTRWREKRAFDSEVLGWKDLPRVREWVDSVVGERQDGVTRVDNPYPLPPFNSEQGEMVSSSLTTSTRKDNVRSKLQRPLNDWIFEPSDLLADAYWLDQDGNAALIEDRDGNKLFDPKRWSRGRLGTNGEKVGSVRRSLSNPRLSHQHEKKSRSSSKGAVDETLKDRAGRTHRFRESITSLHGHTSSTDRKSRWHRKLMRSRGTSSSDESRTESLHRQGIHSRQDSRDAQGSAVLEKQMMDLLAKEAEHIDWGSEEDRKVRESVAEQSSDISPAEKLMRKTNGTATAPLVPTLEMVDSPMQTNTKLLKKDVYPKDLEQQRGRKRRSSLDEIDSTGPNSPIMEECVPSISISLSAPASRSVSPEKGVHTGISSSTKIATGKGQSIEAQDFASKDIKSGVEVAKPIDGHIRPLSTELKTPVESLLSPKSAEGFGRMLRHHRSNKSMRGPKERRDSESRFRLLKGGRLTELVGNEVSRVGEFLWRGKESNHNDSNNTSAIVSPTNSVSASDVSDSDDNVPMPKLQRSTSNRISQLKSEKSDGGRPIPKLANNDQHKFHLTNLPSFRSPLRRGEQVSPTREDEDPIGRQQAVLRERGRSRGFDRLAPPPLDMRAVSESPSPTSLTRVATRETVDSTYDSRGNSVAPSETNLARSDMKFRTISGLPQHAGAGRFPITGLASYDGLRHKSMERPKVGSRQWSISDRGVSAVRGTVTRKDVVRARALLLSSGVKAVQISRKANSPREVSDPIYAQLQQFSKAPLPVLPRKEEHVLAARIYVKHINGIFDEIRDTAQSFTNDTFGDMHERIRSIGERIEHEFTPRVREAADSADALSAELSTSQRLTVKRLNDTIDQILRRRRRRFRWIRRGGYLLLEWMVLGAMWWIWLVVVIIRLVKGFVGGVYRGIAWLLWL